MKATEILNSITDMLNLSTEVKLEEMKLANGTLLESEHFHPDEEVFIKTEDEKVPLPEGLYELEDGRQLIVVDEGIINEIKSIQEDMSENLEQDPQEEKQEMGYATKDELNEVKSVVEEIKAMIEKMEEPKEEPAEVEVEAEAVQPTEQEELKEELSKPAAEPMKHSPEASTKRKQNLYAQGRAVTTFDRVLNKISNINN
tara:strand:- start:6944 stop:7543 length:600 start_codon:yes stop_codon:yes gene_type:complete